MDQQNNIPDQADGDGDKASGQTDGLRLVAPSSFLDQEEKIVRKYKRSKRLVRLLLFSLVVVTLVLISYPFWFRYVSKDIDPIDDSDLQLQSVDLAEQDNWYYDNTRLEKLEIDFDLQTVDEMRVGLQWDPAYVDGLLSQYAGALAILDEMVAKSGFQDPATADGAAFTEDYALINLAVLQRAARLSALQALRLAEQGYINEGLQAAFKPVRLGQQMQSSQGGIIYQLVAVQLKRYGLEAMQRIISDSSTLSSQELLWYKDEIAVASTDVDSWQTSIILEMYYLPANILDSAEQEPVDLAGTYETQDNFFTSMLRGRDSFYFQPNKTRLILADRAREYVAFFDLAYNDIEKSDYVYSSPDSYIKALFTENAIGKIMVDLVYTDPVPFIEKQCNDELLVDVTQVIFALKAYELDKGVLPQSLEQLVPDYLISVPLDPFDHNFLRYSPQDRIVYSIGSDGLDSGGSSGADWTKLPDPTFKI